MSGLEPLPGGEWPPPEPLPHSTGRVRRSARRVRQGATAAAGAVGGRATAAYDRAVERVLLSPDRVATADEALARLAADEGAEAVADNVQRIVMLTTPLVRRFMAARKLPGLRRFPVVLAASTAVATGAAVKAGVAEVRMLAALLAHRIETETGLPADPALVKKLAVELYRSPSRTPSLEDRRPKAGRLLPRWALAAATGSNTRKRAEKALRAAEQLNAEAFAAAWAAEAGG